MEKGQIYDRNVHFRTHDNVNAQILKKESSVQNQMNDINHLNRQNNNNKQYSKMNNMYKKLLHYFKSLQKAKFT